jgi:hypothetical protein
MRLLSPIILSFSAASLVAAEQKAQDQAPILDRVRGWFNKAQAYIPSTATLLQAPTAAVAAKYAEKYVHALTLDNWKSVLTSSRTGKGPEQWLVFVTGGNKTCSGRCANVTRVWNVSGRLFSSWRAFASSIQHSK